MRDKAERGVRRFLWPERFSAISDGRRAGGREGAGLEEGPSLKNSRRRGKPALLQRGRPKAGGERAAKSKPIDEVVAQGDLTVGRVAEVRIVLGAHGAVRQQLGQNIDLKIQIGRKIGRASC